jgi:hypothetical protein
VVEVEQGALGALEQHALAASDRLPQHRPHVDDERSQALAEARVILDDVGRCGNLRPRPEQAAQALVGVTHPLVEGAAVEQVAHAQPEAAGLVLVGGADATAGRADRTQPLLGQRLGQLVIRQDDVRLGAHEQALLESMAQGHEPVHLLEERGRVDHDAVADQAALVRAQDPGRHQVEDDGVAVDDHAVAGVRAALVARDQVVLGGEHVDDLALALVAPLGAEHHRARHVRRPGRAGCRRPGGTSPLRPP